MILSVIIPTYKDDKFLLKLIEELKVKIKTRDIEILISCTHTEYNKITKKFISKKSSLPNLKIIKSNKGRASQMNSAALIAKGKYLWFLHADTEIKKIDIGNLIIFLKKNSKNIILSFPLKFNSKITYFRIIEFTSWLRQKYLKLPFGDQGILVSKKNFDDLNGFKDPLEDLNFSLKIKRNNFINKIWSDNFISSPRRFIKHGVIYTHIIMGFVTVLYLMGATKQCSYFYNLIQ